MGPPHPARFVWGPGSKYDWRDLALAVSCPREFSEHADPPKEETWADRALPTTSRRSECASRSSAANAPGPWARKTTGEPGHRSASRVSPAHGVTWRGGEKKNTRDCRRLGFRRFSSSNR